MARYKLRDLTYKTTQEQRERMYNSDTFINHLEYLNSVKSLLIEADKLRASKEFKQAANYFRVLHTRGYLLEGISRRNEYSVIKVEG